MRREGVRTPRTSRPAAPTHRASALASARARARSAQRPRTRGREEGVHRMALKTPEEFVQSLADLHLQIYLFGEKIDDYVNHPIIRPSINCIAMTYELAAPATFRRPHAGHQPPDRRARKSVHPHPSVNRRPHEQSADAAQARPADGHLLSTLRRHGRDQRALLRHARVDAGAARDYHARFVEFVRDLQARTSSSRRHDRSKGDRSQAPHEQDDPDMFLRIVERRAGRRRPARRQGAPDRRRATRT